MEKTVRTEYTTKVPNIELLLITVNKDIEKCHLSVTDKSSDRIYNVNIYGDVGVVNFLRNLKIIAHIMLLTLEDDGFIDKI